MPLSREEIKNRAIDFSARWKNAASETAEGQVFVNEFLAVFGVDAVRAGHFEKRVLREEGHLGEMDYFFSTKIAIEMKSKGKDLGGAYEQLKSYVFSLPAEEMPELLMVCDFETIVLRRRNPKTKQESKPIAFKTKDLLDHVDLFHEIAGLEKLHSVEDPEDVNTRAAKMMADIHDCLERHGYKGHDLEIYLVRLLFCMFAEDTGIFPKDSFLSYVKNSEDLSGRIGKFFEVLNMSDAERNKRTLLSDDLKKFRFIDGGLFEKLLPTADFDEKMRQTLIRCCEFDWSKISPAIFGSMFQGVMDRTKRREIGAHYTNVENILKVIDPLFMDDLRAELARVKTNPKRLDDFHAKIAKLKFFDPACGCGNFLMIAYQQLRELEIDVVRIQMKRNKGQRVLDISTLLQVNVNQFYGIEIEDFPCEVARVGMWLMDHLMNIQASKELGQYYERLPLTKDGATIVHGNAHRIDWESVVPKSELTYILGNPPYVGYSFQNEQQKKDILSTYLDTNGKPLKTAGKIDYVAAWYYKAAKYITGTQIRVAFVSTNSITQGEQVAAVWKPLFDMFGLGIDFAYRTFKWTNEAPYKAAVHCVIIGFSQGHRNEKVIYDGNEKIEANNINPYLVDAPVIFVESRTEALCDVPAMVYGNKPADGGHLFIEAEEYKNFVAQEPQSRKYIRKIYGAVEYINAINRYCLWLVDAEPSELRKMPLVMERVEKVRRFRLSSPKKATQESAATPTLFQEIRQPRSKYILVPRVSSERRNYIPIGFVQPKIIVSDAVQIIPNGTLYHFGILTSSVHMAWMRAVCGRLKSDYRYSKDIVYNNFPWADATDEQRKNIETFAQAVLDTRAKFPDSSLADLYDPLTMPKELLKAHQNLDRAIMKLYKFKQDMSEPAIVAALMEIYQKMTEQPTMIPEPSKPRKKRTKMSSNQ